MDIVAALFDQFDADNSGSISYDELNKGLHRTGGYVKPAAPKDAAGGGQKHALRKALPQPLGGAQIDLSSDVPVMEQLRGILKANSVRVIDLFKTWDENHDGKLSKKEFKHACEGFIPSVSQHMDIVAALFDQFDADNSGSISYDELNKGLHRTGGYIKPAAPKNAVVGGKGAGGDKSRPQPLGGAQIDLSSDVPVMEQLRGILKANSVRVIDLFKTWDENHDGRISKKEFKHACEGFIPSVSQHMDIVAALFDQFDADNSGSISYDELNKGLHRTGGYVKPAAPKDAAGGGQKHALRKGGKGQAPNPLAGCKIDLDSGVPVRQQLKDLLHTHAVRLVDVSTHTCTHTPCSIGPLHLRASHQPSHNRAAVCPHSASSPREALASCPLLTHASPKPISLI